MGTFSIVVITSAAIVLGYFLLKAANKASSGRITLQLDEMYTNTTEMACAVFEELKKQGRECEIIELGKGYPKFLIDGKEYVMTHGMTSISGFPMQVVRLKICKR